MNTMFKPYAGIWLFERDDDHEHIYRAVPPRDEALIPVVEKLSFFPTSTQTDFKLIVGDDSCNVVKIKRLPFQIRIQEMTRTQALRTVCALVDFEIEVAKFGLTLVDVHEGNVAWWNSPTFIDFDAFKERSNRWTAITFVRIAYLLYRYVSGVPLVAHDQFDLLKLRKLEGWMGQRAYGQDFTSIDMWHELKAVLELLRVEDEPTHWSTEYASNVEDNKKIPIVMDLAPAGKTLLDVGCNKGYMTKRLMDRYEYAVGIDLDEHCIDIAQRQITPNLNFARMDIRAFQAVQPFPIHKRYWADTVLALALTHHLENSGCSIDLVVDTLSRLTKSFLILENIVHVNAYNERIRARGFEELECRVSYPQDRTITLWTRK